MDAPVPASALIHSATLVSAGVFLTLRLKPLLICNPTTVIMFSYLALLTVVVGGLSATYQNDLKKILAYSTISNCGLMMFLALNSSAQNCFAFFASHGITKAFTFACIGLLIITANHKQDWRYFGARVTDVPHLFVLTAISIFNLSGFSMGMLYFLKHNALYTTQLHGLNEPAVFIALSSGAITSAVYGLKIILLIFFGNPKKTKKQSTLIDISESTTIIAIGSLIVVILLLIGIKMLPQFEIGYFGCITLDFTHHPQNIS